MPSTSPRSLDTFGVSGLLDAKCKVFYYNLFSPNHVGRVSDLLSARLRAKRIAMNFGFACCSSSPCSKATPSQIRNGGSGQVGVLSQPITLECGIDGEKMAIGISIEVDPRQEPVDPEVLPRRVRSDEPETDLEQFLRRDPALLRRNCRAKPPSHPANRNRRLGRSSRGSSCLKRAKTSRAARASRWCFFRMARSAILRPPRSTPSSEILITAAY